VYVHSGHASVKERQEDEYGQLHAAGLHAAGRIILNLWRLLRGEVSVWLPMMNQGVATDPSPVMLGGWMSIVTLRWLPQP
jgi:hypothetical protein